MITDVQSLVIGLQSDFDSAFPTLFPNGIAYQNARFDVPSPQKGVSWARFSVQIGEARQTSFGASTNRFRYEGSVVLDVFSAVGDGDADQLVQAAAVEDYYRGQVRQGAQFRTPTFSPVGVSGEWWLTRLVCPFYADRVA